MSSILHIEIKSESHLFQIQIQQTFHSKLNYMLGNTESTPSII